jgi:hypothetical protein
MPGGDMLYGTIPGVTKPIVRVVQGTIMLESDPG